MKLSLVVMTAGKQEGKALAVSLSQFLIGRDPQCQLRPASPLISKRHCAVIQRDGKVFVRDFDSTNGTFVNDQPIKGEVELKQDDKLKVGPLLFRVQIEDGVPVPVSRPTPAPPTKSAAPAAPKNSTPVPATKAPKPNPSSEEGGEDDIAAMLLEMGGDDATDSPGGVPEGSTVFDMNAAVPPPGAGPKPAEKKEEKPKHLGNTSGAAKELLDQMMRRNRSPQDKK